MTVWFNQLIKMTKEYSMVIMDGFNEYFMVHYVADVNAVNLHTGSCGNSGFHSVYVSNVSHSRRLYESDCPKRIEDLKQIVKNGKMISTSPLVFSGYCKRTSETLKVEVYLSDSYTWKVLKGERQRRIQKAIGNAGSFWSKLKVQLFGVKMSVSEQRLHLNKLLNGIVEHRQRIW